MLLLIIFSLLVLYNFIRDTFRFEPVTRTSFIILPIYATIMTVISMIVELKEWHFSIIFTLALIGVLLGWFQTFSLRVIQINEHSHDESSGFKYCRGWSYLYGFILIFIVEIITNFSLGERVTFKGVFFELINEILRERFKFLPYNGWVIWLLLAVTTSVYTLILIHRYPIITKVLTRKQREK